MRISELVYSQALAALISNGVLYIVLCLLSKRLANLLPLLLVMGLQVAFAALWSFLSHQWYFGKYPPSRSAIIYDAREGLERLVQEYGLEKKFKIYVAMTIQQALANKEDLANMETVFLSGIHSHDRNILLKYCVEHDITVYVIPRIGDVLMSGAHTMHLFHLPMLRVGRYHPSPIYLLLKRGFDILVSGLATILLSPVFVVGHRV